MSSVGLLTVMGISIWLLLFAHLYELRTVSRQTNRNDALSSLERFFYGPYLAIGAFVPVLIRFVVFVIIPVMAFMIEYEAN